MASKSKRPDGRWRARYRDRDGREHSKHLPTAQKAQDWLDKETAALVTGTWVDPDRSKITVGEWADRFLKGRVHLKPKTIDTYESLLRTQIRPTWGRVSLAAITHADVVAWVAAMRASGLSPSRVRQAFHLFGSMLNAAVKDRRLPSNPAADVDLPRLPTLEHRYLTHGQVAELADGCGDYGLLVYVLSYTGCRWGEVAALRAKRVDTMRGRLEIVEAVTAIGGRLAFGTPKTHAARSVPVPAFLRDALAARIAGLDGDALVFTSPLGGTLRVNNFRRGGFDKAARSIGLEGLVPHSLRHTAASLAISAGASVLVVQRMLGHASATQTLDRYGGLFGDDLDTVADRLDEAARAAAEISRTNRGLNVVELPTTEAR